MPRSFAILLSFLIALQTSFIYADSPAPTVLSSIGVRRVDADHLVFVRCNSLTCTDISVPWQVEVFSDYLQASLAEAKANALYRAGLLGGLSVASELGAYKIWRSLQEMSLTEDFTTALAEQSPFFQSQSGSVTRFLENSARTASVAGDIGRVLAVPMLTAVALASLAGTGKLILEVLASPNAARVQGVFFDKVKDQVVYLFSVPAADRFSSEDQERQIGVLIAALMTEYGV